MNNNTFPNLNNTTAAACLPGTLTLEDFFATICEAIRIGTREKYEKALLFFEMFTPAKVNACVEDFVNEYSEHVSVCKSKVVSWRYSIKRKLRIAVNKLKDYIRRSVYLIVQSEECSRILRGTYYIWDWFSIGDIRYLINLLKDTEELENGIEEREGRRFIHELNGLLCKSLRRVENSSKKKIDDELVVDVWTEKFLDDIDFIVSEHRNRWDDYISRRIERGREESEVISSLLDNAEMALSESDFYIDDYRKTGKLVRHIRSLQENDKGEELDKFMLYYAQAKYLRGRSKVQGSENAFRIGSVYCNNLNLNNIGRDAILGSQNNYESE